MEQSFGTKGLYSVVLKATYDIEDLGVETGEVIAAFDNIQIGGLDELKSVITARGGYGNPGLVSWDKTQELNLTFSQGVFSTKQFNVLVNSKCSSIKDEDGVIISTAESFEGTRVSYTLLHDPIGKIYVYYSDGTKTKNVADSRTIALETKPIEVIRYDYKAVDQAKVYSIGNSLIRRYISLEGRMRLKDDETGHTTTGIIKIPKLKLMSGLSMRLGRNSDPYVANFRGVAYPDIGPNGKRVCDFYILPEDIDRNDIMI